MVLTNRPTSGGGAEDAYEVLDGVFGGEEFDEDEATTALCQALQITTVQAKERLNSLVSSGCVGR
jgi:hypothetical protein